MGGRNTVLLDAISCRIPLVSDIPTIIFGADVTHPENGEDSSPSIAAVHIPSTRSYAKYQFGSQEVKLVDSAIGFVYVHFFRII